MYGYKNWMIIYNSAVLRNGVDSVAGIIEIDVHGKDVETAIRELRNWYCVSFRKFFGIGVAF